MGMFDSMHISASGLSAERLRMDVIAQNLANVNSTRGPDGQPYRRHEVVFEAGDPVDPGAGAGGTQIANAGDAPTKGVRVAGIVEDPSPMRAVYDPSHPDADDNGYVYLPNVNPVTEMVDMMTA